MEARIPIEKAKHDESKVAEVSDARLGVIGDELSPGAGGCEPTIGRNYREVEQVDGDLRYPNGLAIDPSGSWLFLAQSGAANVLRIPIIDAGVGEPEVYATIAGTVPDGLALAADGDLYVGCYTPDAIYRISAEGAVEPFLVDPWADILNRPTDLAFGDGVLYFANLGGYHPGAAPLEGRRSPVPTRVGASSSIG